MADRSTPSSSKTAPLRCPACHHLWVPIATPAGPVECKRCGHLFQPDAPGQADTVRVPEGEPRIVDEIDKAATVNTPPPQGASVTPVPQSQGPGSLSFAIDGLSPGLVLGKARIVRELGRGGMGAVYLGEHLTLESRVAVKILAPDLARRDPGAAERFLREARLAARIRHPNLVQVLDADHDEATGIYYIVMEYVDGGSVLDRLHQGPLAEDEALHIVASVAVALAAAHQDHIIHRDIKPANIMLTHEGQVKLADLGLAKELQTVQQDGITASGSILGTPAYMSPEQASDTSQIDPRSDIYSLGATLYHMLTGHQPYEGETPFNVLARLLHDPVPDPRQIRPELSESTALLCMKMMTKDRDGRTPSASALLDELGAPSTAVFANPSTGTTGTLAAPPPRPREFKRDAILIGSLLAVLVIALAGALYVLLRWQDAGSVPSDPSRPAPPALPADTTVPVPAAPSEESGAAPPAPAPAEPPAETAAAEPADTTPPHIRIQRPAMSHPPPKNPLRLRRSRLLLSGTAGDKSGVATIAYQMTGATQAEGTARGTDHWYVPAVQLRPGTTTVELTATDRAGNARTLRMQFVWRETDAGPAAPAPNPAAAPEDEAPAATTRWLPEGIRNVTPAAGGRVLLIQAERKPQLTALSLTTGTALGSLPLPADDALIAGGKEVFLVLAPEAGTVQRYHLGTLKLEVQAPLELEGRVKAVALGANSEGPALIHWSEGTDALSPAHYGWLDVNGLQIDPLETVRLHNTRHRDFVHLRASADGSTFGLWCTSHSPQGLEVLARHGSRVAVEYRRTSAGAVLPGPFGERVYTHQGVFDPALQSTGTALPPTATLSLPAADPPWFLSLQKKSLSIRLPGLRDAAVEVALSEELGRPSPLRLNHFTLDKRIHFLPREGVLATIPKGDNRVLLRQIAPLEALAAAGENYLFVRSRSTLGFSPGTTVEHQVEIVSSGDGVHCSLVKAPPDLQITRGGRLRWPVPRTVTDATAAAIILIRDESGQELFHRLRLRRN